MRLSKTKSKLSLRFAGCALTCLAAALFSGCLFETGTRVAGGAEDFPNTIQPLGMAASTHTSDHADWDQFSVIPSSLPSFQSADSLTVPIDSTGAKAKPGAGKISLSAQTAAIFDSIILDLSDTATLKVGRRIHKSETLLKFHTDTTTYRYDAAAKDSIKGNELILEAKGADLWKISGRLQTYKYENTDSTGGFDRATYFERTLVLGNFRSRVLVMLPGPDGDIATPSDNRPAYYASAITRNLGGTESTDTLESFKVTDADGDGMLWGDGDSGLVDFKQTQPNPVLRPAVSLVVTKMRAMLFKEETKTYPVSYSETRTEKDGKTVIFSVKGSHADSTFAAGDTAIVSVHVTFPADARIVEKHSRYRVLLGGQPKHYDDNQLIDFTLYATWRTDSLVTTKLKFTPDHPVRSKELSISGALNLSGNFTGGDSAEADGTFENKIFDVEFKHTHAGKLRRFHINWDAAGKVLLQQQLD